jgi:hypothetical protein
MSRIILLFAQSISHILTFKLTVERNRKRSIARSLAVSVVGFLSIASWSYANAATYYVATTGLDTNNGTSTGTAWKTIQKAATTAVAGDTVNIQPGTYSNSITLSKLGTASAPITFTGAGGAGQVVVTNQIKISGAYYIVNNIKVTPPSGVDAFNLSGNHTTVSNCIVTGMRGGATGFSMGGSFDTITTSTIQDSTDIDAFRIFGHDNTVSKNIVTGLSNPGYASIPWHADFVQTFGDNRDISYNQLIENNYVHDNSIQMGNITYDNMPDIRDWTFRNNLFINNESPFFIGIRNTFFYNNTFYQSGNRAGYPISFYGISLYDPAGSKVVNNIFLNSGSGIASNSYNLALLTITNNYFGTATFGTVSGYKGSNYINGGDPKFVNAGANDFHLQSSSPAIDKGTTLTSFNYDYDRIVRPQGTAWDMGAFEYTSGTPTLAPPKNLRITTQP